MCNDRFTADYQCPLNIPLCRTLQKKPATSAAEYKKTDEPQPDVKEEGEEEEEEEKKEEEEEEEAADEEPGIWLGFQFRNVSELRHSGSSIEPDCYI